MLYLMHKANHEELSYRGGQEPIVHLEANIIDSVSWAEANGLRWAFTPFLMLRHLMLKIVPI